MSATVSDFTVSRLGEWGIERLYGYSGDGINGFMAALRRAEPGPRLIQPRHEEVAAFMASGHAKFSDRVGVCVATSGPGGVFSTVGYCPPLLSGIAQTAPRAS